MSVDSFAKIDMSLDDIIKLDKKEKKKAIAAKKVTTPGKKLTAVQIKRAAALKLQAKNARINKLKQQGQGQGGRKPGGRANQKVKITAAQRRGMFLKRNNMQTTKGGRVVAGRGKQTNLQTTSSGFVQRGRGRPNNAQKASLKSLQSEGAQSVHDRLGGRIKARQNTQKQQRQSIINRNRRGRGLSRVNVGRGRAPSNTRSRTNPVGHKNVSGFRNRQYNQQPRRGARTGRSRGNVRNQQQYNQVNTFRSSQQNQQRGNKRNAFRSQKNRGGPARRGRGRASSDRLVTMY